MTVATPDTEGGEAAPRRDGALHLRPPARLPHLPGERRLRAAGHGRRRRAARRPLRLRGRQPPRRGRRTTATPTSPSTTQVHRLLALRAGVRRDPGHVRPHHRGPRLRVEGLGRCGRVVHASRSACRAAPACRRARPRRCRRRPSSSSACRRARVKTTCAYCGVGCSFEAELRGDEVVRMVPAKEGGANEGHSCVKGRFAWGYATHRDRAARADGARRDHRPVARGHRGTRPSPTRPRGCTQIQASTASAPSAASRRRAAPTKRSSSSRR